MDVEPVSTREPFTDAPEFAAEVSPVAFAAVSDFAVDSVGTVSMTTSLQAAVLNSIVISKTDAKTFFL